MHDFSTLTHVRQRAVHATQSAEHAGDVRRAREAMKHQNDGWLHTHFFHKGDGS